LSILAEFFKTNSVVISFAYPLTFFLMGFGILLKNTIHSHFYLAKSLYFLALFGILHGIADWGVAFIPFQKTYLSPSHIYLLESIQFIINAISFFFLFYFGMHLLIQTKQWNRKFLLIPLFFLIIWSSNFIFLQPIFVNDKNQEWWFAISDIWARYLLAFPGGAISSYALYLQKKQFQSFGVPSMTRRLYFAMFSVASYALAGGLIVPYAPVLPAILFNSNVFFHTTGIPIELFRGLSAFLMAFYTLKILKVFDLEFQNFIYRSEKTKAVIEERSKIARDLHDGMIQSIYATGLQLEKVRNMLLTDNKENKIEQSAIELQVVVKRLNDVIREIRGYIKKLNMSESQEITLKDEIKRLIDEMDIKKELQIFYDYNFRGEDLPLSHNVQIYYIVKEALSNVLRHANASEVIISIQGSRRDYTVEIEDNGTGMENIISSIDKDEPEFLKQGIKNMKVRAQSIGGNLIISSVNGIGTRITLQVGDEVNMKNGQENQIAVS
jgi:signal transduction histidine kinase